MASTSKNKGGAGEGDESKHFAVGDVVLGKIKGYPPWPGILVDDDNVPKRKVLDARPGKSYFIVRFFPAADYGFNKAHELRKLHKREIEAFLSDPHKKGPELREAYVIAKDPEAWNAKQNRIVKEAERKGSEEKYMLDDDDEEDEQPKKKRKATSTPANAKKPKVGGAAVSKQKPLVKAGSAARKSAGTEEAEGEEEQLDPETKKVRGWRHSLQRGFLSKEGVINPDEMENLNKTMKQVEEYKGITADVLRLTKIGKVMRRVVQLPLIPRDDEFKFRERAEKLCDEWAAIFSAAKGGAEGTSAGTNGTSPLKEDEVTNDTSAPPGADESTLTVAPN